MQHKSLIGRLVVLLGAVAFGNAAWGSVILSLSPSNQTVSPGGTVTVTVNLTSTSEHSVGLDYFLRSPTSNIFTLTGRSLAGSPYTDPITTPESAVFAASSATLNKTRGTITGLNGNDLGALGTTEQGAGTFLVGTYTLKVSPTAANGPYTLATYSDSGNGYSGGASTNFAAADFAAPGTTTITVVPEPAAMSSLVLVVGLLARRRRAA